SILPARVYPVPIFFTAPPPTSIYTLSLHDALPIFGSINRLECEHRRKVCSVSGDVMLSRTGDATSICAITAPHSLSFALAASLKDRKSTRLNSSHLGISYAVFCLKKKKKKNTTQTV